MRQNGYDAMEGEASRRVQVTPPSVDPMRPQRLLGRSGSVATTWRGSSGSTAMSGDPYWREGAVSNLVACTARDTRIGSAAPTGPPAARTTAKRAPPATPTTARL